MKIKFNSINKKLEILQSVVTTGAIIIGGIWTYRIFLKERKDHPHANIQHEVSHIKLNETENLLLLSVIVQNEGKTAINLDSKVIRVQQIKPIIDCKEKGCYSKQKNDKTIYKLERDTDIFTWPMIFKRESQQVYIQIEPNEKQKLSYEFVLPSNISDLRIYTHFKNSKKSKFNDQQILGWSSASYYNFD